MIHYDTIRYELNSNIGNVRMVDFYLQGKECVLSIVAVKVRVIEISARDYRGLECLNQVSGLNVYLRNI